ncbi:MAG: manganese efflux pump [Candidatus Magnetomorum sp.]|nr:manganese efflux pump [Candidatus Magnetomorum sp.]
MSLLKIIVIAIALAMDAFTVAIAVGIRLIHVNFRQTFRLSWHFGFFQAIMPVMGWSMGVSIRSAIEIYDHWIAFGLLAYVGGNMLKEAFQKDQKKHQMIKDPTKGLTLVMLSIVTSIDALAVGFSISMLNVSIIFPAIIIGCIATLFTGLGLYIGKTVGASSKLSTSAESIGGIILLMIGGNILLEHGVFDRFF